MLLIQKITYISSKLLLTAVSMSLIGILLLYSAANTELSPWALNQFYTLIMSIFIAIIIALIDSQIIFKYSYLFYVICVILLIIAEILGHKAMGAQRWIKLGSINLQPSEPMKIAVILSLAKYFHKLHSSQAATMRGLIIPIVIIAIPISLILKQPNLGTALIIIMISIAIFFVVGVSIRKFAAVLAVLLITLPISWNFIHTYQKQRVLTFLHPEQDPLGAGYNIIQSKIAIGSGGLNGKGLFNGSQNQLSFLPEKQTDFIFTLLAEEFGLMGVSLMLTLYTFICLYCYHIAYMTTIHFNRIIAVGVSTMIFIHVLINTAMVSGLLPAVGTPLPFLSFGRSNLVTCFIAIGLVLNVKINKNTKI